MSEFSVLFLITSIIGNVLYKILDFVLFMISIKNETIAKKNRYNISLIKYFYSSFLTLITTLMVQTPTVKCLFFYFCKL